LEINERLNSQVATLTETLSTTKAQATELQTTLDATTKKLHTTEAARDKLQTKYNKMKKDLTEKLESIDANDSDQRLKAAEHELMRIWAVKQGMKDRSTETEPVPTRNRKCLTTLTTEEIDTQTRRFDKLREKVTRL
jgi:chromosome segregation ATPase